MNDYIDRLNYLNDSRTQGPAKKPVLYVWACSNCGTLDEKCDCDADMVDAEEMLPTKWEVCPVCRGEGKHVNPGIDAGGLSADYANDPDFMDDYMDGVYDVPCNRCKGKRVVAVVDWNALDDDRKAAYEKQLKEEADDAALQRAELAMGA